MRTKKLHETIGRTTVCDVTMSVSVLSLNGGKLSQNGVVLRGICENYADKQASIKVSASKNLAATIVAHNEEKRRQPSVQTADIRFGMKLEVRYTRCWMDEISPITKISQ